MADTNRLILPLLSASQAQKHVTVNEALKLLDAIVQAGVIDKDLTAPPGSPSEGDIYIVGSSATGDWASQDDDLAIYQDGAWTFVTPLSGWIAWVADETTLYVYSGGSWILLLGSAGNGSAAAPAYSFASDPDTGMYRNTVDELGFATGGSERFKITDTQITATIASFLITDQDNDADLTVSKQAIADDASVSFKTNFSTRSIIGLLADDNFTIKVSPDGAVFHSAVTIDKDNGKIGLGSGETTNSHLFIKDSGVADTVLELRAGDADSGVNATFSHASTGASSQIILEANSSTNVALIDINPKPSDGTSNASFRIFRETNTTGARNFDVFLGNGTSSTNCRLSGNSNSYVSLSSGNFGIGISNPSDTLSVAGIAAPTVDNSYTLGKGGGRWSAVWAANGTIQTSDARDKIIVSQIGPEALQLVEEVTPIFFKWRVGGNELKNTKAYEGQEPYNKEDIEEFIRENPEEPMGITEKFLHEKPGRRTHAGFLAQDLKKAMDLLQLDFGAWGVEDVKKADSKQFIRPDQLVPILWQAVRELKEEMERK